MQKILSKILSISLLLTQVGCFENDGSYDPIDSYPITEESYNLKKMELSKNSYQISFQVIEPYPSMRLVNFYRKFFNEKGWISCSDSKWFSYQDFTSEEKFFIHELIDYWVNFDNKKLLVFNARYYSLKTLKINLITKNKI